MWDIRRLTWVTWASRAGRHQLTLPALVSLSRQSTSASPEIRHSALSSLSRALLGPLMVVPRAEVAEVFQRVLYPLLEALLDAPANVETTESRLRASVLLCKAFMKFEISDNVAGEDVTECWVQVVEYLGRIMHVDQSDQLVRFTLLYEKCNRILTLENRVAQSEAVHESIKNAILVMHTAGMLAPLAGDPRNEGELWRITRDKIEQFMPGFMESVVPLSSAATLPSSAEVSTTASPTAENQEPSSPVDTVKPRTSTEPVGGTSIV
jgi:brefeldin A-resistance guanine nucleotide exchange factor 1